MQYHDSTVTVFIFLVKIAFIINSKIKIYVQYFCINELGNIHYQEFKPKFLKIISNIVSFLPDTNEDAFVLIREKSPTSFWA